MATENAWRTIKALVLDFVHQSNGRVSYEALTEVVRRHFPTSRWKKSHWAWYRYQILHGRFRTMFSNEELTALSGSRRVLSRDPPPEPPANQCEEPSTRGPIAKDAEVKRVGDQILNNVRFVISVAAGDDIDKRFKLNRWVFSRLLQDEIRVKRPIKQRLWADGMRTCQACGEKFASLLKV